MCPGAPLIPVDKPDIGIDSDDEELFISLEEIIRGSSLPENVITDVDPYEYMPSDLPAGIWFLFRSSENRGRKFGYWKVKKVSCKVLPKSSITGWKTKLIFYEGQTPHGQKTDWVMHEYKITKDGNCDNKLALEASALCRVSRACEGSSGAVKTQKLSPLVAGDDSSLPYRKSSVPKDENANGQEPNCPQVYKDDGIGISTEREYQHQIDDLDWDDYIELQDLDYPLSPYSGSGSSSFPSMSPDEYFDPLALLLEIEADINQDNVQTEESYKSSATSYLTPDQAPLPFPTPGPEIDGSNDTPADEEDVVYTSKSHDL